MSGTQDLNSTAQITVNTAQDGQSGIGSDFQTPAPEAEVEETKKSLLHHKRWMHFFAEIRQGK